jgi:hypothetical protein
MIRQLQRKTLLPTQSWGLDSVQGLLEFAENPGNIFKIVFDTNDINDFSSPYFHFKQLEKEGYLNIQWLEYASTDKKTESNGNIYIALISDEDKSRLKGNEVLMNQVSLTTSGRNLLEDLRQKAKLGTLKKRIIDLLWVIATAIITTLITLKITK